MLKLNRNLIEEEDSSELLEKIGDVLPKKNERFLR